MTYAFDRRSEPVARAVRRLAGRLLGQAASDLRSDEAAGLHQARKSIKKARALLRLVRDGFDGFDPVNAELRDIARSVAASRDAEVLPVTVAILSQTASPEVQEALSRLAFRDGGRAALPAAQASARLDTLRRSASDWQIDGKGFGAIEDGLARSWRAARRAARRAERKGNADAIHEWRKRVKDHWYHARLLTPIWPPAMEVHARAVGTVSEHLGDCQDIDVLLGHLDRADLPAGAAEAVRAHARDRIAYSAAAARELADHIFCEDADALLTRWRAWWDLWRGGA